LFAFALSTGTAVWADEATKQLLELKPGAEKQWTPQYGAEPQVSASLSQDPAAPGLVVTFRPGKAAYPGVGLKPAGAKAWDLSGFGHVEARVVNTGTTIASISLRVDNDGDWHAAPWNTESIRLKPQEAGTVKVIFGYQYGHKPGYALKAKEVVGLVLFTDKSDTACSFRIESLVAGGPAGEKPPIDPASVRIKSERGVLLGPSVKIDLKSQVEAHGV
jgi:hypothetical protein